jgi:hypothetical protein
MRSSSLLLAPPAGGAIRPIGARLRDVDTTLRYGHGFSQQDEPSPIAPAPAIPAPQLIRIAIGSACSGESAGFFYILRVSTTIPSQETPGSP